MQKLEKEIKILNIDKSKFIKKLEQLGAKFISKDIQVLYTFDLQLFIVVILIY